MARGIRYTREFQEKALRLLGESRANHSSETEGLGLAEPGHSPGDPAPLA